MRKLSRKRSPVDHLSITFKKLIILSRFLLSRKTLSCAGNVSPLYWSRRRGHSCCISRYAVPWWPRMRKLLLLYVVPAFCIIVIGDQNVQCRLTELRVSWHCIVTRVSCSYFFFYKASAFVCSYDQGLPLMCVPKVVNKKSNLYSDFMNLPFILYFIGKILFIIYYSPIWSPRVLNKLGTDMPNHQLLSVLI